MRLLVFTTLFPHPGAPHHGIFVRERLRAWLQRHGGSALVVAPVPFVPGFLARGPYAAFRSVPAEESFEGMRILHPRYPLIPKVSMSVAPWSLAWAARRALRRVPDGERRFDLVDAHYLYPDAVAAAFLARDLDRPLVVTARGTDVNLIPRHAVPRRWLRWMLGRAQAGIAVCGALRDAMQPLHGSDLAVRVLGNGVDLDKFRPEDRTEARRRLGWAVDQRMLLSVGHLIERKGHHHLLEALPLLPPDVRVRIVGAGPEERALRRLARDRGVQDRVEWLGTLPHEQLATVYSAADRLVLLSSREGWPNVLLEAMACGTPVLATRVWGTPEVVTTPAVGSLVEDLAPPALARQLLTALERKVDRAAIRSYAEQHSWGQVADGMEEVFQAACRQYAEGGVAARSGTQA